MTFLQNTLFTILHEAHIHRLVRRLHSKISKVDTEIGVNCKTGHKSQIMEISETESEIESLGNLFRSYVNEKLNNCSRYGQYAKLINKFVGALKRWKNN